MSIPATSFDPSRRLDIYFRIKRDGNKEFIFIDANGAAIDISGYQMALYIREYSGARTNTITLTVGSGLTVSGAGNNRLAAALTVSNTNVKEGEYYFELYKGSTSKTLLSGRAIAHNGVFDGVSNDTSSLTISDSGDTVVIQITSGDSGGDSEAVWGDITGTLADQTDLQAALDAKLNKILTELTSIIGPSSGDLNFSGAQRYNFSTIGTGNTRQISFTVTGVGTILQQYHATTPRFEIIDLRSGANQKGLENNGDYSANFTARSLIDKAYMEAAIAAAIWSRVTITSDVTNNNAVANTLQDVTGLSFPVVADKLFAFHFFITFSSASSVNGSRWTINGPAKTSLRWHVLWAGGVNTPVHHWDESYDTGVVSANARIDGNTAEIWGVIECSSSASEVIARFASEAAGTAIVAKAGSYVEYKQLN